MNNISGLCIEKWFESLHQLQLLANEQRNARAALDCPPTFREDDRQGVFVEERIHRLDRFRRLDGAERVELVVAVNSNVNRIAYRVTGVLEAAANTLNLVCVNRGRVTARQHSQ